MRDHGLWERFSTVVKGFIDTLPIYREKYPERKGGRNHNLSNLVEDFVGEDAVIDAHDALGDVKLLSKLITATNLTEQFLKGAAKTLSEYIDEREARKKLNAEKAQKRRDRRRLQKTKSSLSVFTDLTNPMKLKMAKAGVSLKILKQKFREGGAERVTNYLSESIDGKPRVRTSERILQTIIIPLQSLSEIGVLYLFYKSVI